jgi:hypothetical protein
MSQQVSLLFLALTCITNLLFSGELMEPIQLNHIYLVVDRETYESIKTSDLMNSFAVTYEQKNTADNQMGWEGFYIRGKHTYIEFFYPQERYPKIGISGIGMGVDIPGALEEVTQRLKKDHPDAKKGSFSRNGKPWFEYVAINDSYFFERNSFWIMEYAPEHFQEHIEDVSRAHYNGEKYDPQKLLLDIQGFAIALEPKGSAILESYLTSSGLNKHSRTYSTSENVKITVSDTNEQNRGIYQILFSLNQYFPQKIVYQLGNSRLTFEGNQATWDFSTF